MTSESADLTELREQLALGHRLLHHYGLAAYQGHVSARVPGTDRVLIRAHPAVSLSPVQAAALLVIDPAGNVVRSSAGYPVRAGAGA